MFFPGVRLLLPFILVIGCSCSSKTAVTVSLVEKLNPGILSRSAWEAMLPLPFPDHHPGRITIHHEGTLLTENDDAARKIKGIQRWGMGPDRNWADIPYHFLIAPDGKIYEGRNVYTAGETATEYDPAGHLLICCLGNLDEQALPEAQLNALIRLVAYASAKYDIPLSTLAAHKDYSTQTGCPGRNLYPLVKDGTIRQRAAALLRH